MERTQLHGQTNGQTNKMIPIYPLTQQQLCFRGHNNNEQIKFRIVF